MPTGTIGELQRILLEAVFQGRSPPTIDREISLPDRSFVLEHQPVIIAEENVIEPDRLEELSQPVEILPLDAIKQRAEVQGNIAYLHFQSVEREDDTVWLTLKAEIAPQDPEQGVLGLSGVRIGFRETEPGQWVMIRDPTYFAA